MKKIRIIGVGLIIIFVLLFSLYLINRFSYSKELPFYSVNVDNDSTLTIGIIGDSWVAGEVLDSILHNQLLEKGFSNKIVSSGHPGAKSKLVYQNLFKDNNKINSSKFVIENNPDYCIVIAGVNDAIAEIGSRYYAYHMEQIIRTLLDHKIKPVIVSLPEFGIVETIDDLNVLSKNRNLISACFTNNGELDNIKTYRKVLVEKLKSDCLQDSVNVIDFDKVCMDYKNCSELYSNSSHLSHRGNELLGYTITNELIKIISAR